jgi:O-acetyl-ADP-ribose deacetylase (regulator of RNase III)
MGAEPLHTAGRIEFARGDITREHVGAIVNAANHSLLGGGGVDGAIHRAGGPAILAACRELRAGRYRDGLPTGEAVETTAGDLDAEYIIHTVGPVYAKTIDHSDQLAGAYRNSLALAASLGVTTIAFPAVSAGVYGWPIASAAQIAVHTVRATLESGDGDGIELVRFVLFTETAYDAFVAAAA